MARHLGGLRLGIAMGSGAALGYSIIGILRALERNGIYPDLIAGTSMGALVGSFYAAGRPVSELVDIALSITKKTALDHGRFRSALERRFGGERGPPLFEIRPRRYHVRPTSTAFRLRGDRYQYGMERVLRHGAVAEAVRGSLSLPFFFEPYYWQGRYLVDGGLVNPVPTSIVQAMGADITLSVNNTTAPALKGSHGPRQPKPSVFQPHSWPPHFQSDGQNPLHHAIRHCEVGGQRGRRGSSLPTFPGSRRWSSIGRQRLWKWERNKAEKMMPKILAMFPFYSDQGRRPLRRNS
jgi:predicted acylesterase/phospholipase RssA